MNSSDRGDRPRTTRVGIVMLTWNALEYTKHCLGSLLTATTYPDFEVVVVDNGSSDGTVEWLRSLEGIRVVENGRNLGFTGGVNVGLATLPGDCDTILVNNDLLVVQPDWIERLRDCAYASPDVGVVGCRLVDAEGRLLHAGSYVTPVAMRGEQIGDELDVGQYPGRRQVQCAVGAALYVKRAVLDVTGGLHREYFSYFEDTDLCLEAARAGYRTMYEGGVTLVHHQNVSTRENRADLWAMFERSHGIFVRRWEREIHDRYHPVVELRAPLGTDGSGAGDDSALDFAYALHESRIGVALRDLDGTPPSLGHPLFEDMAAREAGPDGIELVWADPRPGARSSRAARRILVAGPGPEATDDDWIRAANLCSEVWAGSRFAQQHLERCGVEVPVLVVGHGIDTEYFHPRARRMRSRGTVLVGALVDWSDRYEPVALIRAFNREFSRREPAVLHCQVRHVPEGVDVEAAVAAANLDPGGGRVVVTHARIARAERCALYRSWDVCLVSAREPWTTEAVLAPMAVGTPTAAYCCGAAQEVLDAEGAWPTDPDPAALAAAIREILSDPGRSAERARTGARLAAEHTWARTAGRVRELLAG